MKRRDILWASGAVLLPVTARAQVVDLNDAINKAGRQRMLSQRMAKSYFAIGQGVEPELADRTLAASMTLFDRQLVELKMFAPQPLIKATYTQLESAWGDYKAALVGERPGKSHADEVIALASKVLALAHQGTGQLEKVADRPLGRLVNISGRQRMLSQRMAALYLSASWGVQTATSTAELTKARDEFVAAHQLLKGAPEARRRTGASRRRIRVPPPSAGSALTSPPCTSATWRTIASPSPEPAIPRADGAR